MAFSSVSRVLAIAALFGVAAIAVFAYTNTAPDLIQTTYRKTSVLEARASKRFAEMRGLTPCEEDDRRWLKAAERKLAIAGQSPPRTLVLVAPAFSDMHLLAFNSASLDRYTFPQETFGPEFIDNDRVAPRARRSLKLPQNNYERVMAAISRNSEFAMSSRETGRDGVMYYFKSGADQCAVAWSPTEGTIGGHLTGLIDLLLEDHPSMRAVEQALGDLEALELAH